MSAPTLCFIALYRGRRYGATDMEIVIIAPSWKRAAEMAEDCRGTLPDHELVDLAILSTEGALIDKDSM